MSWHGWALIGYLIVLFMLMAFFAGLPPEEGDQ